ncbi:MAG: hypothetical protein V1860_03365 [bacterium]
MTKKISFNKILFFIVIISYLFAFLFKPDKILPSFKVIWGLAFSIAPLLILVFIFMAAVDYYMPPEWLKKHIGHDAGIKKWVIGIVAGVAAVGPPLIWYPMLKDLKEYGVQNDFLAVFLYCKAINVQFFPMIIFYFGLKYLIVITILMIVASVTQGFIFRNWNF